MPATLKSQLHGLYWLDARTVSMESVRVQLTQLAIPLVNIGLHLADLLQQHTLDAQLLRQVNAMIKQLLTEQAQPVPGQQRPVIAIHNLGILAEPSLQLAPALLLEHISKYVALIFVWEDYFLPPNCFSWTNSASASSLRFTTRLPQLLSLSDATL